jgi:hypothetical protein
MSHPYGINILEPEARSILKEWNSFHPEYVYPTLESRRLGESPKFSSGGTVHVVAMDFNPWKLINNRKRVP